MMATWIQALQLVRNRPFQFLATVRSYILFYSHGILSDLFLRPSLGYELGPNVRIQNVASLGAERPGARIKIGSDSIIYENAKIQAYGTGEVVIGEYSILGDVRIISRCSIRIGARVLTSWNVFIQDFDPHPLCPKLRAVQVENICRNFRPSRSPREPVQPQSWNFRGLPIEIGDDVWIGANVTILKGARIGRGTVVAAGSVVTAGDWPSDSLLAGSPARVVRSVERPVSEPFLQPLLERSKLG